MRLTNIPISRKSRTIALLVLVAVGIGAWQLWPEPVIGIPGRVCQEAVPGHYAAEVLPKRGEHFKEEFVYAFTTAGMDGRPHGTCDLSGGGKYLDINFVRQPTSEYDITDLVTDHGHPGSTPVTLGPARGYARGWRVALFTVCSSANGKAYLEVNVTVNGSGTPDGKALKNLADLAGATMRAVANKRASCTEGTPKLPAGPPKLG